MMPPIDRPALPTSDYIVPRPRTTDAIGMALRGAYDHGRPLPDAMTAALRTLDHMGRT